MENKRIEVINAAIKVIAQKGTVAGSIADIAKEAGLSKSTMYFYFASKEEMLIEIYDYCGRVCADYMEKDLSKTDSAIEKLTKRFVNMLNFTKEEKLKATLIQMYAISPQSDIYSTEELNNHYTRILEIIKTGQSNKEIVNEKAEVLANAFYGFSLQNYMLAIKKPELFNEELIQANCHYIKKMFEL